MDNEILSGWKDLLNSALYELTAGFYIKTFFAVILFSPLLLDLIYRRYRFIDIVKKKRGSTAERALLFFPPAVISIFFILSLLPGPGRSAVEIRDEIRIRKGERPILAVRDISKNPLSSFFHREDVESRNGPDPETAEKSTFSFGLDTTSLSSNRVHPRKNIIPRGKKLNIIIYFFESTSSRYLDEKINNSYVTPNWRKLEKNAFVARNHYANFPLSANSLYTIITSSYEKYSRDLVIQKYPRIKNRTIYEILKDKGYRTCLIHTGSLLYAGQRKFLKERKIDRIIEYRDLIKNPEHRRIVGYGIDERAMIKPGIDFMKKDTTKPFCVTFFPLNPHHPYAIPDSRFRITGKIPENADRNKKRWMNYLNSLHYADFAMGELVRELEKNGLMENTLFILLADHGQAFYQHRENLNHRRFLYDENVHVPFLIYNRKFFRKQVTYRGVSRHLDILPTILDILGISQEGEQEGVSLFSSHREQFAMLHTSWNHEFFGIRDGRWKYIYRVEDGYEELYNLSNDPREMKNIAPEMENRVALFRHLVSRARLYNYKYYKRILGKDQQ
jgi:arylsulfatase A-like enzyme